jgi:hypothetical protein
MNKSSSEPERQRAGDGGTPGKDIMQKLKWIFILLGIFGLAYGCDATSQDDVKRAIYTVMRGYEASTDNIRPQVSDRYTNAAKLEFKSQNDALINEMSIAMKEDKTIAASGTCYYAGYEDPYSGYRVDGKLAYDCEKAENDDAACEFSCNTTLAGGKVKNLEFLLTIDADGRCSVASVIANGKKVRFNQWAFVAQIVRAFSPSVDGGQ